MDSTSPVHIEVAYAKPGEQVVLALTVAAGTTAREAVELSGILERFPEISLADNDLGIFGSVVSPDRVLKRGDRVEIYRPLQVDPREARRQLAAAGLTMGKRAPGQE